MANASNPLKDTTQMALYEAGGQLDLLRDKGPTIVDCITQLQAGSPPNEVDDTSAAIAIKNGVVFLTKAGVAAMTLAAPTSGAPGTGDDGRLLEVIAMTANAHTVTTPTSKINGNKNVATFGGAVLDRAVFRAYGGVWYLISNTNITLSGS